MMKMEADIGETSVFSKKVVTILLSFYFQTDLSQLLQSLSEKAKAGTEFIQKLKAHEGRVQVRFGNNRSDLRFTSSTCLSF